MKPARTAAAAVLAGVVVAAGVWLRDDGPGRGDPVAVARVGATLTSRLLAAGDVDAAVGIVERVAAADYRDRVVPVLRAGFTRLRVEAADTTVVEEVTAADPVEVWDTTVVVRVATVVTVSGSGRQVRTPAVYRVTVVEESGWRVAQVERL